jgi:hypothetical protein
MNSKEFFISFKKKIEQNYSYLALALIFLPALICLVFILTFGVNLVYMDEFEHVSSLQKLYEGNLSVSNLFSQHNEPRIFFPRILYLSIASLTGVNTVVVMACSWVIIVINLFLIYLLYQRPGGTGSQSLLAFIPVAWLLFILSQWENLLWGFQVCVFLCVFGFLFSLYMLNKSENIDRYLFFSVFGAIIAIFSFTTGFLVWVIGFLYILLMKIERKRMVTVWILSFIALGIFYFYGWVKPANTPSFSYILFHPVEGIAFFMVNVGVPVGFNTYSAIIMGSVILLATLITFFLLWKYDLFRENINVLAILVFSLFVSASITIGRAGWTLAHAMTSRYVSFTVLGIIGLYLIIANLSVTLGKGNANIRRFYGIFILILCIGVFSGYSNGWHTGERIQNERSLMVFELLHFQETPDESLKPIYPRPEVLKTRAGFLEKNHLNVFAPNPGLNKFLFPFHGEKLYPDQTYLNTFQTIAGKKELILYEHPIPGGQSIITHDNLTVKKGDRLTFSLALDPLSWSADKGDGVTFDIFVNSINEDNHIFSQYVDPKHNVSERTWNDFTVDLTRYEGKNVTLIFSTSPGPRDDAAWDWAWWGDIKIDTLGG